MSKKKNRVMPRWAYNLTKFFLIYFAFYLSLGFVLIGKDNGFLILRRGVNTTVHTQRHLLHVEAWQDKTNFG